MFLFIRLAGDLPVMQKSFFRNFVALFVALISLAKTKTKIRIKEGNFKYLFIRSLSGGLALILNFYAVDKLDISDASILNKLSPFFAIIFSYYVLKEKANKSEWLAVILAFIGAIFVIKPQFNVEVIPAIAGFLGGCGAGFAYTYLRKLGKRGEESMIIVLFFSAFSTLMSLPFLIIQYQPMTKMQLFYLLLTGVSAAFGQIFITKAYREAPASKISVYDFTHVIFTALLGYIFLNQLPDYLSVIGYIIIIGAAYYKWHVAMKESKAEQKAEQKTEQKIEQKAEQN